VINICTQQNVAVFLSAGVACWLFPSFSTFVIFLRIPLGSKFDIKGSTIRIRSTMSRWNIGGICTEVWVTKWRPHFGDCAYPFFFMTTCRPLFRDYVQTIFWWLHADHFLVTTCRPLYADHFLVTTCRPLFGDYVQTTFSLLCADHFKVTMCRLLNGDYVQTNLWWLCAEQLLQQKTQRSLTNCNKLSKYHIYIYMYNLSLTSDNKRNAMQQSLITDSLTEQVFA